MIKGMSGFGQARAENLRFKVAAQVRTVNHRYLDISVYLPEALRILEQPVKERIKRKIKRGKVNVSFEIISKSHIGPRLNEEIIASYVRLAERLNKKFNIAKDISFAQLLILPQVLEQRQKASVEIKEIRTLLLTSAANAANKVVGMRRQEGTAICNDLRKRASIIKGRLIFIERELLKTFERAKKRLSAEELVSFKRNCDVSEELVRLKFHTANLLKTAFAAGDEPRGKELDFISQELQREINTLGAKVADKNISCAAVRIKSQLESLREQLQNVE